MTDDHAASQGEGERAPTEEASDEPQVKSWERFFKTYLREEIASALSRDAGDEPFANSVIVSLHDLFTHDSNLYQFTIKHPYEALSSAYQALKSVDIPATLLVPERARRLIVRFTTRSGPKRKIAIPSDAEERVAPDSSRLGQLVVVRGVVKQVDARRPNLRDALFICSRCGNALRVPQDEHLELQEPKECYEDQGGCGREVKFKLIVGVHRGQTSLFTTVQRIVLEENIDDLHEGLNPATTEAWLEDDAVNALRPGQRVVVTAVQRTRVRYGRGNKKSTIFEPFLEINGVDQEDDEDTSFVMTQAEEEQLKALDDRGDVLNEVVRSCAPHISGNELAKRMMLLSLVGGIPGAGRSQIHLGFIGDPGTGKTQLARWMTKLARRVVHVSGPTATIPGLTMSAEKNGEDEIRSVQPGAYIMASNGILLIDEAQGSPKGTLDSINEAMEEQTISKTAANIPSAHVRTNTTVWVVANPVDGRWDPFEPKLTQCGLPAAFQSRLDGLFLFEDRPDKERDIEIARAIMARRYAIEAPATPQDAGVPVLSFDFLRKFVALCRTHIPRVPPEVAEELAQRSGRIRNPMVVPVPQTKKGKDASPISHITHRQGESIARFAEAIARVERADEMTTQHVDAAEELVMTVLRAALDGQTDLDIVNVGSTTSDALLRKRMLQAIREFEALHDRASRDEVFAHFGDEPAAQLTRAWRELVRSKKIYEPEEGVAKTL